MTEFRKLADGVYVFLQPPLVWYSSVGVIVGEQDVVVVDSVINAAMAQTLLSEIRNVTDKPIRFLVNTHSHADHTYTNHLFPGATSIASHLGRECTRANQEAQELHSMLYAELFPDIDFAGGRYTLQDMSFSGSLAIFQGEREICLLELGAGHSESDVVVHLPEEKIVLCGDVFLSGMPPMPGEGHVSQVIANYRAIEALQADVYVAGHGDPGTLADVVAQRVQLESLFRKARECWQQGIGYDAALEVFSQGEIPLDFQRMVVLSSYCEFAGKLPETSDPGSKNHLAMLQGIARQARLRLGGKPGK